MTRRIIVQVTLLVVLFILTRIPYLAKYPVYADTDAYVTAVSHLTHVHIPGYTFYIYAGYVLNSFVQDPLLSLTMMSSLFCLFGMITFFFLAQSLVGEDGFPFGLTVSLGSNIYLWYCSVVPSNHVIEILASCAVAVFLWQALQRKSLLLFCIASFALATGFGFRQTSGVFLFPLWFYSLLKLKSKSAAVFGCLIIVCVLLVWLYLTSKLYDGFGNYLRDFHQYTTGNVLKKSSLLLSGINIYSVANLVRNVSFNSYGLQFFLITIMVGFLRLRMLSNICKEKLLFLLIWILPAAFFYAFFLLALPGYLFTYLPALYLFGALGFIKAKKTILKAICVLSVCFSFFQFFYFKTLPETGFAKRVLNLYLFQYSFSAIKEGDYQVLHQIV